MPGTVVRLPAAAIVMSRAEPGLLADRYRLDELLASGGTGQVWRAVDLVLQRPVAVKLLRPEVTADPDARARFVLKPVTPREYLIPASPRYTTTAKALRRMRRSW